MGRQFLGGPFLFLRVKMTERLARWSLYATAALALVVIPGFYFPFVTPRTVLFRILTLIASACLLLLTRTHRVRGADVRDPILIALVSYLVVSVISAFLGVAPWRSFFGDFERMWGVLTIAHFVLYYALLRTFFRAQDWPTFFNVVLIAGGLACATALVQRMFGVTRPAGSMGNPGYLAIYSFMLSVIAISGLRRGSQLNRKAALWALAMGVAGFSVAATRGAMVGAGIAAVWAIANSGRLDRARLRRTAGALLLLGISVAVIAQTSYVRYLPLMVQRVFTTSTRGADSVRLFTWRSAVDAAADRPIFGWGPENTTPAFNLNFDPAYYRLLPKGDRLDRFHNAYLEALATTGVLGLVAFLAIWVAAALVLRAGYKQNRIARTDYLLLGTVLIANAGYFFFWFEDLPSFALLIAMLAYLRSQAQQQPLFNFQPDDSARPIIALSGLLAIVAYSVMHCIVPLRAARYLEQADGKRGLSVEQRVSMFEKALHPMVPQRMHTILRYSNFVRALSDDAAQIKRDPYRSAFLQSAIKRLNAQVAQENARDPLNDIWPVISAQLAITELAIWRSPLAYYAALSAYEKAIALSPERVRHRLSLAKTYLLARDTARALQQYRTVVKEYPALGETYAELAAFYHRRGDVARAADNMLTAFQRGFDPGPSDVSNVVEQLIRDRDWMRAQEVLAEYLELRFGRDWVDMRNASVPATERSLVVRYAVSLAVTQRTAELHAMTRFANAHDPLLAAMLNRLTEDAPAGRLSDWLELVATQ